MCPSCWSTALVNRTSSGRGVIHTFTVQHRPGAAGFADEVPYTLVLVDLDEGVRVLADLRDYEEGALAVGMRVKARFEPGPGNVVLPRFRPAAQETT
ncbi:OB-fold domain-containing protein [Actinomadura sp. 7K507]|uniref:Zn-ribbon domain-containing OB-fold protein n=1 Tax=Actinomadura sp. 7K507 TaxID=2530365 RepID=UPI002442F603|nr:OB-fold domain-containing protein [Actinomadura sp. 7K507]